MIELFNAGVRTSFIGFVLSQECLKKPEDGMRADGG